MRYTLAIILLTLTLATKAQKITRLDNVSSKDSVATGQVIICGNFIQRLGFKSGGFAQEFYIADTATKEIYAFRVKPVFKSARENTFAYHIKPGTYALLKYQYHESKWYGVKEFHEPVSKADKSYYMFTVRPNSVVNLGNWHFDKQPASFTEPSDEFKDKLAAEFKNLRNFVTVIPK